MKYNDKVVHIGVEKNRFNHLYLFKVENMNNQIHIVDIGSDSISFLLDKDVNQYIVGLNKDYYECSLDKEGTYYCVFSDINKMIDNDNNNSLYYILFGFAGICLLFILLMIVRRNDYRDE